MKIVVTGTRGFPGIQGGVENHCEHLYPHLTELGCNITVFSRKPYSKYHKEKYKGITLIPIGCPQNKFLEAIVHTFISVLKARRLNPDILHIHAIGPSLFAPLARVLGMKVIVTNHGPDYKRKKWGLPAKMFLKFCEMMGIVFANKIITIAGNISDEIKKKHGKEAVVIPNGVTIPPPSESADYLMELGLEKKRYILAVGRFVPEKGFDDLIDAFSQEGFGQWKLVIVGDADHEDKYSSDLKIKARKNSNIILTGFLAGKPLYELYTHARLFVIPSYYEGLPIVLLEAMSYGLSCIASDIQANKNVELSEDRFFATGEVESIKNKMKKYVEKQWGEEEIREQIALIGEKYNWSTIALKTLEVYKSIIVI